MSGFNEGRCCDAVLRILEVRHGANRHILSIDSYRTPGIEVRCTIGGLQYALEHTTIDPYPDRRLDDQQFLQALSPLETLIGSSELPPARHYHLLVDVLAFRRLSQKQRLAVSDALAQWIKASASKLRPPEGVRADVLRAYPPDVPVSVMLQCWRQPESSSSLTVGRLAPEDRELELMRRNRVRALLDKKGPKLQVEHDAGARTILIVEDDDIALSNKSLIEAAIREEISRTSYSIDEIYLVEVTARGNWHVYLLNHRQLRKQPTEQPDHWEVCPDNLQDVTRD